MRYVPMPFVEPGMLLGLDLYDGAGRLLLAHDLVLNEAYIRELTAQGYPGLYIEDELSGGVEIHETIRPEVRREALAMVSDLFAVSDREEIDKSSLQNVVMKIVEDVCENEDIMCNMLDIKRYDDYTYFHSVNVGVLSSMVGAAMGYSQDDLVNLTMAAMLHDVGKKFIPVEILNKEGPLNGEQREVIETHSRQGADFIREKYTFSSFVNQGILQHHENYDGSGYPMGRQKDDIAEFARIISIVDVYDALTSKRPYRDALPINEAVEFLMANSGKQFDPDVLDAFLHKIAVFPTGAQVELSDGKQAIVVQNYPEMILRPRVRLFETKEEIDLAFDPDARNITIVKMIMQ